MDILGVIDLLGGRAVHAAGGRREQYAAVEAVAGHRLPAGDAPALARVYLDELGIAGLYVADLDAILGNPPQDDLVSRLARLGAPIWLDQGARSVERAEHARALGAAHAIIGLETLPSWDVLTATCGALGGAHVAFSLDLRDGVPILAVDGTLRGDAADEIAARAGDAGVGSIIVIDVGRVGTGSGLDLALIGRIRRAVPHVRLLAGGGVRSTEDLTRLAERGCDGALVATALHTGRIGATAIAATRAG